MALPSRTVDLTLLEDLLQLIQEAPGRPAGKEGMEPWFTEASAYWKEVFLRLRQSREKVSSLMEELLGKDDYPTLPSYDWKAGGELVPSSRGPQDLCTLLGMVRYRVPGPRSCRWAILLLEKMIARIREGDTGEGEGDPPD